MGLLRAYEKLEQQLAQRREENLDTCAKDIASIFRLTKKDARLMIRELQTLKSKQH